MRTSDLCDEHPDLRVLAPIFRDYGGVREFSGEVFTVKVFEDNVLVRSTLETPGNGRVLVVDGGGSLRVALVGGQLGELAVKNGWAGIVVNGCVRDAVELAPCKVGIKALATMPLKSKKLGAGETGVQVSFAAVDIVAGDWLYADEDGIVVSARAL